MKIVYCAEVKTQLKSDEFHEIDAKTNFNSDSLNCVLYWVRHLLGKENTPNVSEVLNSLYLYKCDFSTGIVKISYKFTN